MVLVSTSDTFALYTPPCTLCLQCSVALSLVLSHCPLSLSLSHSSPLSLSPCVSSRHFFITRQTSITMNHSTHRAACWRSRCARLSARSIFDLHRKCTKDSVESACGVEAAEIADQLTVVTAGEPAKVYCSNLTVTSLVCSRYIASSSLSHIISNQSANRMSVLLLVILLLLNSICRTLTI